MIDWITNNPGLVLLLFASGTALFHIGRWTMKVDSYGTNFQNLSSDIKKELKKINKSISKLIGKVEATVSGASPVTLTDKGKKISTEIDGKEWAAAVAPDLYGDVFGKPEYEIYEFCSDYVVNEHKFTTEQEQTISKVAYQNAVSRDSLLEVLVVELRDHLLTMYGIT